MKNILNLRVVKKDDIADLLDESHKSKLLICILLKDLLNSTPIDKLGRSAFGLLAESYSALTGIEKTCDSILSENEKKKIYGKLEISSDLSLMLEVCITTFTNNSHELRHIHYVSINQDDSIN